MRQVTRLQIAILWLCVAYSAIVLILVALPESETQGRLRLVGVYREPQVPREVLVAVSESAARDFNMHRLYVGFGFVLLCVAATSISCAPRSNPALQ